MINFNIQENKKTLLTSDNIYVITRLVFHFCAKSLFLKITKLL